MNGCTAGFFFNDETKQAVICPDGFFCPEKFRCLIACVKGASCTSTEFQAESSMCTHATGFNKIVEPALFEEGLTCPGPAHELICPGGYYCPYPTDKPKLCEEGSYCPRGSFEQKYCGNIFITCPRAGLEYPLWAFFDPDYLIMFIALCGLFYGFYRAFLSFKEHQKLKQEERQKKTDDAEGNNDEDDDDDDSAPEEKEKTSSYLDNLEDKGDLRMDITFNNLGLVLKGTNKKVLNGVTGSILSGRITACMGPSGKSYSLIREKEITCL